MPAVVPAMVHTSRTKQKDCCQLDDWKHALSITTLVTMNCVLLPKERFWR
jgi:hypothetical protein